jgi:hypothetical protein
MTETIPLGWIWFAVVAACWAPVAAFAWWLG